MTDLSSHTLHVVARELTSTLNEARAALEAYAERSDQPAFLEKCAEQLHLAHGVLRLVEVHGAALLAEEMEQVTRYILGAGDRKRQGDALDALMRAMVQLPTYLERVLSGGRDLALVLLPLLNDLRSVRGSQLLSEGTLLLLNLKSDEPAQPQPQGGEGAISVVQWARRLRPRFQVGLLGYIRGERTVQNLEILAKVSEKLEQIATTQPVFQLWWVVGALLEAVRANGIEGSATLKRLLGQADRQIKALYELGEARYGEKPPVDLLNNLLYYVARATAGGNKVAAVRASFKLTELLPVDDTIEQERESLSAPSVKLMRTVAAAIKEDLSKVKDVFDIFVRRGGGRSEELIPQLDMLKKISDTLGVLGLGELRQRVHQEVADLSETVTDGNAPSEAALIKVAGVLLSVEDSLDEQLVSLILPASATTFDVPVVQDHEFRQVSEAVLRECIVNMARIKEAVSLAVQKPAEFPVQGMDSVPQLLRGITAGLLMLGKGRAVELMDAIGAQVRRLIEPGAPAPDGLRLERLADAIVSVEYYMETLQNGRNDPWYMLDNAETCLSALDEASIVRVPNVEIPSADIAKTVRLDSDPALAAPGPLELEAETHPQLSTRPDFALAPPPAVEPQIAALFVEEAKEEIESIGRSFPAWDHNPADAESLALMRRSFHTLKGSGRMVGARTVSEFAWSVENLLNRLIDKTRTRSPAVMVLLREAVAALPQLVAELETGVAPTAAVAEIMARATAMAEGRDADTAQSAVFLRPSFDPMAGVALPGAEEAASPPPASAEPAPAEPARVDSAAVPGEDPSDSSADGSAAQEPAVAVTALTADAATASDVTGAAPAAAAEEPVPPIVPPDELQSDAPATALTPIAADPWNLEASTHPPDGAGLESDPVGHPDTHLGESLSQVDAEPAYPAVASAENPSMDPLLHDIYSKETSTHLAEIRDYVSKRAGQPPPHLLPESIYRAIHTLSGSSKMAEARHGIRVTEPLNHVMRKVYDSGHGLTDAGLAVLADAVRAIDDVVSHINESTSFFSDQTSLLERLQRLDVEIDAEIARSSRAAEHLARDAKAPVEEPTGGAPPESDVLAETLLAADLTPAPDEAASASNQEVTPAREDEPRTPPPAAPDEDFDRDIAKIYSEEATELLEAAEASLAAWKGDRRDRERLAELQRQLHTLKGGARMAGVSAMGDLSHEMETLVTHIETGAVPADEHAYAVMQASLDELAHMRDLVSAGTLPAPAAALLGRIRDLDAGVNGAGFADTAIAPPTAAAAAPDRDEPAPPAASETTVHEAAASVAFRGSERAAADAMDDPEAGGDDHPAVMDPGAAPVLPGRESVPAERVEMARVDADLLDTMLNNAGEVSIFRARLDQQVNSIDFNLAELARTVTRLKDQLRGLEIETEAQVLNRHHDEDPRRSDFDPLELDRYSALQQFSRALAETSGDVASIQGLLETLTREAQNLLTQQSRVITELQNSLMRTRMVPFQRHVQRLTRLVRQAANDTGKRAELVVQGAAAELDRQMLERMVAPLEHMLRNAVVHGIEPVERRAALGKPEVGRISVSLTRDGAEVVIVVTDDGGGINVKLIREKAAALGFIDRHAKLTDEEAMQLILEPGFSTAGQVTQAAGRGVGMDVVATEVKKLGGGLFIESSTGQGSRFTIRLPFTLAISQALIVRVAEETYALPLPTVEGVVRLPRTIVARHLSKDAPLFEYGGQKYRFQQLGSFVGLGPTRLPEPDASMSVVLIRAGEHSTALVTDELVGSREIVVKSLGPQISSIRGIAGATILGDGRIVVILDMGSLVRSEWRAKAGETTVLDQRDRRTFALVVDDSITVRRVTQRLLERNGMRVLTAKDGVDAVALLKDNLPDIILLDIEMPRMDGYEVAAHVRGDPRLKGIPIVMITSRVSEKHRARAIEIGVDDYLGKPYQESQLLDAIEPLVNRRAAVAR
jgi:chemosensory pili system protein ChpA (sensor histidine kinase/response regulator)